jgi:hypothetical protein
VVYTGPSGLDTVATRHIARLDFFWVQTEMARRIQRSPPGVWLTSGVFIEGDFKGIQDGQCTISSVPLGLRQYDINSEVVSISLGKSDEPPSRPEFEIRTWSGSVWLGRVLELNPDGVLLDASALGPVRIAYHELQEMTRR